MKNLYSEITATLPTHPLRRFFRLISGERKTILNIYLYAIIAGIIGLSLPLGIQAIINFVSTGTITTSWFVLIAIVIGGLLGGGILQILQLSLTESIQQRIFAKSALELSFRIPRLDALGLRKHYVPELVNRFFDTVTVQKGLSKILLDFSTASLQIIFGILLLSFYHPLFILFGFALGLILFLIVRFLGPYGLKTSLDESKYKYELAHWLEEISRKRDLFKGKTAGDFSLKKTDSLTLNYLNSRKQHFRILVGQYSILLLFKILIIAGLLVIGSWLVVENQLNLGQFVAAEIVIILLISSVEKLILSVETIYDVLTGLEKIGYITDLPLEGQLLSTPFDEKRQTGVRFEDFTLHFPGEARPELKSLTLKLGPAEWVWLSGGNPQVHNALIRSIAGDYQTYEGKLSIGGIPVRNWNKDELRNQIGIFRSMDDIVDGTLLENVTLLSGPIPMSEVVPVADALGLSDFVERQQGGWAQEAGPDGMWLPDWVKARLIMSRILLEKPGIIILSGMYHLVDKQLWACFLKYVKEELPAVTFIVLENDPVISDDFHQAFRFQGRSILPCTPAKTV